jgi:hypothetical protein
LFKQSDPVVSPALFICRDILHSLGLTNNDAIRVQAEVSEIARALATAMTASKYNIRLKRSARKPKNKEILLRNSLLPNKKKETQYIDAR